MEKKKPVDLVVHDSVDDLTAPLCASVELTKTYVDIQSHIQNLEKQTRVIKDDDGHVTVIENPNLIKWMTLKQKILSEIVKLQANLETKHIEMKIDAAKTVFENLDKLPPELKIEFLKKQSILSKHE